MVGMKKPKSASVNSDQESATKTQIQQLIQLGKGKGYLTYREINDHISVSDIVDSEDFSDTMLVLGNLGIKVFPDEPTEEELIINAVSIAEDDTAAVEEATSFLVSTLTLGRVESTRPVDGVRQYMREMSAVKLLNREEEIKLAKRIEEGLRQVSSTLSSCPAIVEQILIKIEDPEAGLSRLQETITGFSDEDDSLSGMTNIGSMLESDSLSDNKNAKIALDKDEDAVLSEDENTGLNIEKATEHFQKLRKLHDACNALITKHGWAHKKAQKTIQAMEDACAQLKFTARQIDFLIKFARNMLHEIRKEERAILSICVKKAKMPKKLFIDIFSGNESNLNWTKSLIDCFGGSKVQTKKASAKLKSANWSPNVLLGYLNDIIRAQKNIVQIEKRYRLNINEIKNLNKRMSIGESQARRAKKEMVEANLRLVISIAKKYTNRGLQIS